MDEGGQTELSHALEILQQQIDEGVALARVFKADLRLSNAGVVQSCLGLVQTLLDIDTNSAKASACASAPKESRILAAEAFVLGLLTHF